jgi:hypothetical protein
MWRRDRPVVAPYVSAVEALAMLRAGHNPAVVAALVPAGRERRRFERAVTR